LNLSDQWLCLWPGLPRLWLRGDWKALGGAVLFAGALNLTLIHTFLWPRWVPLPSPLWLWPILILVWGVACWSGWRQIPELLLVPAGAQPATGQPDFLSDAQAAYLRGHWEEAELLLRRQLRQYPDDIAAGLMLATMFRHQGKLAEAQQQLRDVRRWDAAQRWEFEIDRESAAIDNWQPADSGELATDLQ
jgi:hypothetical protein